MPHATHFGGGTRLDGEEDARRSRVGSKWVAARRGEQEKGDEFSVRGPEWNRCGDDMRPLARFYEMAGHVRKERTSGRGGVMWLTSAPFASTPGGASEETDA